jgi:hypothetical protein
MKIEPSEIGFSQTRLDHALFEQAYYKELFNMKHKNVLLHGFTKAKLIAMNITAKPILLAALFKIKWVNGKIDKYKVRLVALGHPGNVQPGVHWQGSKYAATPSLDSARILVATTVHFGWEPKYFDVVTAFLNGVVKETKKIPVRVPPELRTYDENGDEYLALLNKALYGHPIASLRWSQTRDESTLTFLNQNGWGCICIVNYEPCMFVMLSPTGGHLIVVTHTDDFRIAGDNMADVDYVIDRFHAKFQITLVTSGVMLGVEIHSGVDPNGIRYVELTRTDYIERMHSDVNCFMKDNYIAKYPISKDKAKTLITKNLDNGYRTVIGMLLWVQRNTKIDISTSMAYLCRVMASPSDIAFECILQTVQWVYQNRTTRLKFSSDSSFVPHAWYDASNDRDIEDMD